MSLTRAELLLRAAAGAGVVLAGPLAGRAVAKGAGGDEAVLRFGLTLEQLELAFYEHAKGLDLSAEVRGLADEFAGHQRAFVEALGTAIEKLGGTPDPAPRFRFAGGDQAAFVTQAATLEDVGVAALNGAGLRIESKELLAVAGSIVATEAAHAATWRLMADETPTPAAFDERYARKKTLRELRPFLPR